MNTLLMESIVEVQQIVAECNTELIVIEASESSEEVKEDKKKSTLKEKIKKAWQALKNFVSKWWNAFIDMIKKNKAVILNGKKEVEYKNFETVVKNLIAAIKENKQPENTTPDTKKATVKEAVKALEKSAAELKKAIDSAKPEKGEKEMEEVSEVIKTAQSVLTQIQAELKAVVAAVGGKAEEKEEEATEEAFVSVLEECEDDEEEDDEDDEDEEDVEESFMAEAAEIFYENVTMLEHEEYVASALEVFEIMSECDTVLESESEEKKKSKFVEKIKKAWQAFINFFKKWWNKFTAFLGAIKKKISQFAQSKTKKIEYNDYSNVIRLYTSAYMKNLMGTERNTDMIKQAHNQIVTKTDTVSKALTNLEKQGKEVKELVTKLDKQLMDAVKKGENVPGLGEMVDSLYSLLNKVQAEANRVARSIGMESANVNFDKEEKKKFSFKKKK